LRTTLSIQWVTARSAVCVRVSAPSTGRTALRESSRASEANARLAGSTTTLAIFGSGSSRSGNGSRGRRSGTGLDTRSRVTVPVGFGVVHALANGDGSPALAVDIVEHVASQVQRGELVNVVGDSEPLVVGASGIKTVLEVVFGNLDLLRGLLVVVVGVQIKRSDDVAESCHVSHASFGDTCGVWGTHVCGVFAEDVTDGHFVLDHLVDTLLVSDLIKILVGPGMAGDLMTVGIHLRDHTSPVLVNSALANIVASDKEGCVSVTGLKLSHNFLSVDVGPVIIGDRNGLGFQALTNSHTAICNVSELATGVLCRASSVRGLVSITARAKVDLAVRCGAVLGGCTTISLCNMSIRMNGLQARDIHTAGEQQEPAGQEAPPPSAPQRPSSWRACR
jgi:hypothetical protein